MPISHDFALPKAIGDLEFPSAAIDAFFIVLLASKDPQTNKAWCPDVVAAMPTLEATFSGVDKPQAAFIDVGQRPEYDHCINLVVEIAAEHCLQMERPQQCVQNRVESQQRAGCGTLRKDQRRSQGSWTLDRRRNSGRTAFGQSRSSLIEVVLWYRTICTYNLPLS
jgi:hypothetical protein